MNGPRRPPISADVDAAVAAADAADAAAAALRFRNRGPSFSFFSVDFHLEKNGSP